MQDEFPSVTVIIPTRPGQSDIAAVRGCRALDYPRDRLDVIVARGRQPAVQRNTALQAAGGELIYFLDDDSVPSPGELRRAVAHFRSDEVKMVGGPNLCPPEAPFIEQVFAVVLASWLAFGPSRARYVAVGEVRSTSEKELILCNLLARRADLEQAGGFDEALYPNEENALMDALQRQGGRLLYDPRFSVQRRPRPTLRAFCKMLVTYGRGRAEQFRLHPTPGSALNFVPPLFLLYLAGWPALSLARIVPAWWGWVPLFFYGLAVLGQTIANRARFGVEKSVAALPLVVATHLLYGFGFWRGLFTRVGGTETGRATEVTLERVSL